jgi:type IV pilus assembly protein PilO
MKNPNLSLKSLDPVFDKIEKLTMVQRILISSVTFIFLVGYMIYFSFLPKIQEIEKLDAEFKQLEAQLARAKTEANRISFYREEMMRVEVQFKLALRALPETQEIPSLLTSISQTGQDAGLEFLLFEPKPIVNKDFYAEIPVSIQVTGGYHNVAVFFDRVSRLPRIVNIGNIKMDAPKEGNRLSASCTAITYQFVDAPPAPPKDEKGKEKKK